MRESDKCRGCREKLQLFCALSHEAHRNRNKEQVAYACEEKATERNTKEGQRVCWEREPKKAIERQ